MLSFCKFFVISKLSGMYFYICQEYILLKHIKHRSEVQNANISKINIYHPKLSKASMHQSKKISESIKKETSSSYSITDDDKYSYSWNE